MLFKLDEPCACGMDDIYFVQGAQSRRIALLCSSCGLAWTSLQDLQQAEVLESLRGRLGERLITFPSLNEIRAAGYAGNIAGIASNHALRKFTDSPGCEYDRAMLDQTETIDSTWLIMVSELQVGELDLGGSDISRHSLIDLPLVHVEYLNLAKSNIIDSNLGFITNLKSLRELCLDDTRISDQGLVHVRHLDNLWCLSLDRTMITDEGLNFLCHMELENLTLLSLNGTSITDQGIRNIAFPNLQGLNIIDTAVTATAITELESKLPNVSIDSGR